MEASTQVIGKPTYRDLALIVTTFDLLLHFDRLSEDEVSFEGPFSHCIPSLPMSWVWTCADGGQDQRSVKDTTQRIHSLLVAEGGHWVEF